MRKAHKLKGNIKTEIPRNFFVLDTEARIYRLPGGKQKHTLRLGVVKYHRFRDGGKRPTTKTFTFFTPEEFWEFVLRNVYPKGTFWVFAHNLDYDASLIKMWSVLTRKGWKLTRFSDKHKAYFWFWRKGNVSLKFVCTLNLFPGTLEEIGKSVGLKKLCVDFEAVDDADLIVYCKRDVEILSRALLNWFKFIQQEDLGSFKFTLAGQAFAAFRHRFMHHNIYIHNHRQAMHLERAGYFGGRVECFYIGRVEGETLCALDVVSMYPAVMRENKYPYLLVEYGRDIEPKFLKDKLKTKLAVARVVLRSAAPLFPVLFQGKLIFPVGCFETVLSTPELSLAFERAEVLRVKEYAFYQGAEIFTDYVDFFFRKRQEARLKGDMLFTYFYKLILNSLYGKFGQKTPRWVKVGEYKPGTLEDAYITVRYGDKLITQRRFAGIVEECEEETDAYDAFVAIAAHVTGYARVKLLKYIESAGWENVYYVDTDCLHVNKEGKKRLASFIQPGALGMLEEQAETTEAQYYGLKDYVFGNKTKIKGIRKDAVHVNENEYEQDKWLRFASRCEAGDIEGVVIVREKKRLSRVYTKAKEERGGGRLSPFRLPDDEGLILELIKQAKSS